MACCSSCYCTPCSCALITGEADAPQCLPPGSELKLDSIGGFDEFNCPKALVPFRGFDAQGNAIINESVPYQIGFIQQDAQGQIFWTNRPEIPLAEDDIGIQIAGDQANPTNSIPSLVGVNSDGVWSKVVARTGQAASTMKWYPTTGFTLEADSTEPSSCTSLVQSLTLVAGSTGPYLAFVASSSFFTVGLSVLISSAEYLVTAVGTGTLTLTAAAAPVSTAALPIGTFLCGVGFRPVSGITSSFVDTLTGSLAGASASLTFPSDVSSQKVPGLFWRDQLGKVSFLAAPVDGSGVVVANQVLKTPTSPTAGAANLPTFVSIPGGYTWLATPSTIAPFTYSLSPGGPSDASVNFNVSSLAPAGSKMVILDVKANFALGSTSGGATVYVTINNYYASLLTVGNSFGTASDTNQIIVPIESNTILTMTTDATGVINNGYSQTVRVLGFIG